MVKHSRRYTALREKFDPDQAFSPNDAVAALQELATAKFDESVELHLRTGVDPRHADQLVRGVTVLPHGLGKQTRVLVFANGEGAELARQAGADFVGEDDLIKDIEGGWTEFDVGLAIPDVMAKIGKLGRILGRKGLMPTQEPAPWCSLETSPGSSMKPKRDGWNIGSIAQRSFIVPWER